MAEAPRGNAVAPAEKKTVSADDIVGVIQKDLESRRDQLRALLPAHITPEHFVRVVLTAIWSNNDLLKCTRESILRACLKCATDGLVPDGREAALAPFRDTDSGTTRAAYMPMVFGIVKRLRQSGEIASITVRLVYSKEVEQGFATYEIVDGVEKLSHKPILVGERGTVSYGYCIASFKDGSRQYDFLNRADIDKRRAVSKAANGNFWKNWFDEMALKTVIRHASKMLPLSAEDRRFVERSDDDVTEFEKERKAALAGMTGSITAQFGAGEETVDEETGEIGGDKPALEDRRDERQVVDVTTDDMRGRNELGLERDTAENAREVLRKDLGADELGEEVRAYMARMETLLSEQGSEDEVDGVDNGVRSSLKQFLEAGKVSPELHQKLLGDWNKVRLERMRALQTKGKKR